MKEELKISVIIPVYNIKDYLKRCVDSITNQTYRNLEIILVDDGSTDGSGVLCDQLAEQDVRIAVIHKKNGGLSDARNAGIAKASGEVISFIDGDDYVKYNMYEVMMQALDHNISLVACGRTVLDCSGKCISNVVFNDRKNVLLSKEECFRAFLSGEDNGFTVSCCNKIFRREFFEDIRFTKGLISKDIECLYRILDKVENCVCVKEKWGRSNSDEMESGITDCLCLSCCEYVLGFYMSVFSNFVARYGGRQLFVCKEER